MREHIVCQLLRERSRSLRVTSPPKSPTVWPQPNQGSRQTCAMAYCSWGWCTFAIMYSYAVCKHLKLFLFSIHCMLIGQVCLILLCYKSKFSNGTVLIHHVAGVKPILHFSSIYLHHLVPSGVLDVHQSGHAVLRTVCRNDCLWNAKSMLILKLS